VQMNLRDAGNVQMNLFFRMKDNTRLMQVMDQINACGRGPCIRRQKGFRRIER
jgi:hypothetical protein